MQVTDETFDVQRGRYGLLDYDRLLDGQTWKLGPADFAGLPIERVRYRIRMMAAHRRVSVAMHRSSDGVSLLVKAFNRT